jgi:hypothetical protein
MKAAWTIIAAALMGLSYPQVRAEGDAEEKILAAEKKFDEAKEKARLAYRKELADVLALADKIEVYLLDFEMEGTDASFSEWHTRLDEGEFPIIPYGEISKILKTVVLTAEQRQEFLPLLQKEVGFQGEDSGGAFCHFPIHGVRVSSGDKILYQSSFCWHCGNFSMTYPDGSTWCGLSDRAIAAAFGKLMPIPQSEIDRFEAVLGGKGKKKEEEKEK